MTPTSTSILSRKWSDNLSWEFFLSGQEPDNAHCSAVYCLALLEQKKKVVLTRIERGWEMLGGHIEPGETVEQALLREALEEGGFRPQKIAMFGYGKVTAKKPEPNPRHGGFYPQTSYIPYYLATSDLPLLAPTGEEILESRTFAPNQIAALKTNHEPLINLGLDMLNSGKIPWKTLALA